MERRTTPPPDSGVWPPGVSADGVIGEYYGHLNARRFSEAAALFAPDALFEGLPLPPPVRGGKGAVEFARRWIEACPDGQLRMERLERRADSLWEVDVVATGGHGGTLDLGMYQFRPSGAALVLRLRQLFEFRDGRVTFSSVSFDIQALIRQVASVDVGKLQLRLDEIHRLGAELTAAAGDVRLRREVCERLGRELDAARQVLRPYFYRT